MVLFEEYFRVYERELHGVVNANTQAVLLLLKEHFLQLTAAIVDVVEVCEENKKEKSYRRKKINVLAIQP